MKKIKVTIGIPAYNEEVNIGILLSQLLGQDEIEYVLEKIIVASDGSTDKTNEIVEDFKNKSVELIKNKFRNGAWYVQNQIIKSTKSDILVLMDADVSISGSLFIYTLIKPIIDEMADLTSSEITPLSPKTFIEKMLFVSVLIKKEIYNVYNNGNNIYTCHGLARGFSRKLYKGLRFENKLGEDAFSYLYCIEKRGKYLFVPTANINYKLPDSWQDHERQSVRFFRSQVQYRNDRWNDWAKKQYRMPLALTLNKFFKYFVNYPIEVSCYILSLIYIKIKSSLVVNVNTKWKMANTTKSLK